MRTVKLLPALSILAACAPGAAPKLAPIDDQVVAVGGELRIELSATTDDGRALTYHFTSNMPNADKRAEISERADGTGLFVMHPLASDVGAWAFDFTASDGTQSDTLTVQIEVKSAIGEASQPLFRNPLGPGTQLDLQREQCVDVDVMVDDEDSTEVAIAQEDPKIEGGTLSKVDKKKAHFHWCPTPAQQASDDRYLLRLSADDGDNPKRTINYAIVLKKAPDAGCTGTAPKITHSPEDDETLVAVEVLTDVSDDVGLKSPPLVFYGTSDPGASPNITQLVEDGKLKMGEMVLVAGNGKAGTYKAEIPNPVVDKAVGAEAKIWYVITATDNDDPQKSCDHTTQSQVFQMVITNPGGQGLLGVCEPCTHDIQCGGVKDNCVRIGESGDGYCAKTCASAGDCPSGYSCSEEEIASVNGSKARQCVPTAGTCQAAVASCTDDDKEPNDTKAEAMAKTGIPGTGTLDLVSCPSYGTFSDEDWYKLDVAEDTKLSLSLVGTRASDIDMDLLKPDGTLVATSQGPESEEGIVKQVAKGSYLVRAKARPILGKTRVERNPYKLTIAKGSTCTDDPFENDDDIAHARPQPALWGFPMRNNMICSGDDDYYKVEAAEGETITLTLDFNQTKPTENLDLHFLDKAGTDLWPCTEANPQSCSAFSGQSTDSDEYAEYTVTSDDHCGGKLCTFYIVVHGFGGSENKYDLTIDLVE